MFTAKGALVQREIRQEARVLRDGGSAPDVRREYFEIAEKLQFQYGHRRL
jgi:hypothetical protein